MSATASEITFMTDFGVARTPLEKLTPKSKQAVTVGAKPDVDALRRVALFGLELQHERVPVETLTRGISRSSWFEV